MDTFYSRVNRRVGLVRRQVPFLGHDAIGMQQPGRAGYRAVHGRKTLANHGPGR
jgi:hypothetical protein